MASGSESSSRYPPLAERIPPLVPGDETFLESCSSNPEQSPCLIVGKDYRPVAVVASTYVISIIFHDPRFRTITIPMWAVEGDSLKEKKPKEPEFEEEIFIPTKLPWDFRLAFRVKREAECLRKGFKAVKTLVGPGGGPPIEGMFAFAHAEKYRKEYGVEDIGWEMYNVEDELDRQVKRTCPGCSNDDPWAGRGLGKSLWPWFRICQLEKEDEEGISPTYPNRFVVPVNATDKLIRAMAQFRSRARFPLISWVSLKTGAILARASQPLVSSLSNAARKNGAYADEVMIQTLLAQSYIPGGTAIPACFRDSHEGSAEDSPKASTLSGPPRAPPSLAPPSLAPPSLAPPSLAPPSLSGPRAPPSLVGGGRHADPNIQRSSSPSTSTTGISDAEIAALKEMQEKSRRPLTVIFDARSQLAANLNRGRGGGFENTRNYKNCKLMFLNMDNIHVVLASWRKLKKVLEAYNNDMSNFGHKDLVPGPQGPNTFFYQEWDKTGWMLHIQRLLWGSIR
eukprot:Sspe_Gene.64330::Locus_37888_Transcript_1_1_Confidence_1.000_Length_1561::g.64330::m.64330